MLFDIPEDVPCSVQITKHDLCRYEWNKNSYIGADLDQYTGDVEIYKTFGFDEPVEIIKRISITDFLDDFKIL